MATSPQSPPKRPRLSLQITAIANGPSVRTSRRVAAAVDMKSPTAFNTLSNVYATAVDRSTPIQENPPTALLSGRPILRLQTQTQDAAPATAATAKARHTPYLGPYLDTPLTAQPPSPAMAMNREVQFPSAMTATPPLSAQAQDANARVFTFDNTSKPGLPSQHNLSQQRETTTLAPSLPSQSHKRRTNTLPANMTPKPPYTHPRSLRSILRNSPLPPLTTTNLSPSSGQTISPRRTSLRLQEKAARRVAYNSPLEQTITTHKYTRSHIDLLVADDDITPVSPSVTSDEGDIDYSTVLDQTMAYSNLTRDGGQTPGPFEEMRRRMADMRTSTPTTSSSSALSPTSTGGIRKKGGKRREKKRRWVWTIGQDEEGEESLPSSTATPATLVPTLTAAPTKKHPLAASTTVPVIAVPAPRSRSKQQTKLSTAATITNSKGLSVAVSIPSQPTPQQDEQEKREEREPTPIPSSLLPIPQSSPGSWSSASSSGYSGYSSDADIVPPQNHHYHHQQPFLSIQTTHMGSGIVIEPPTPSVESIASSTQDSVFEHTIGYSSSIRGSFSSSVGGGNGQDVEMSDTSSFTSVDEQEEGNYTYQGKGGVTRMADEDTEMDDGTPTMTARPVGAPWRVEQGGMIA
ncbi:putative glucan 1, 4-alpha-glucosidase [Triangularia setosa]|uniref:Glucan 1, 4-alpha-glucosidase n=1 Tax=Triangularia setosa TaxID=2587417 RepID=A0AAN6WDE7_9PEZI|nr:putative glucan 1, 4-alpha-glucosidase [Podospora setosa]